MLPRGGSKAKGVPIDAASWVRLPPCSGPTASPSSSASSSGAGSMPSGSSPVSARTNVGSSYPPGPATVQSGRDARAVQRGDAAPRRQEREQRGDVAVADEQLRVLPHRLDRQERQQLHAAVPAAGREHGRDGGIAPRRHQRLRSRRRVARGVAAAIEHARIEGRLEAQPAQFGEAGLECLRGERAPRRDHLAGGRRAGRRAASGAARQTYCRISAASVW